MSKEIVKTCQNIWQTNLALKAGETALVVCDEEKEELGHFLKDGAKCITNDVLLLSIPKLSRSGEEPHKIAAAAMTMADVVICITEESLTHTKAKKAAAAAGARVATMPGVTLDMFTEGAITADYKLITERTEILVALLSQGKRVRIVKDQQEISFSIEERMGVSSTGVYEKAGESGNVPSGEAYIAPVEGSGQGALKVDGSFVGAGLLEEPVEIKVSDGRLVAASGASGAKILTLLGDGAGRTLAEFGIGTNEQARLTGNVLEDEKIYGTVHLAFGSNATFGGMTEAGVHLDGVILAPTFYIDDQLIMEKGQFVISDLATK